MTNQKIGTRSNRPLTRFACKVVSDFLTEKTGGTHISSAGNTEIYCEVGPSSRAVSVYLFGAPIFEVLLDEDLDPVSVTIGFTDYYDGYGQPTTTVVERLNGLLDCIGYHGIIPEGVRVFRDKSQGRGGLTYLGRGDDKVAVGRDYASVVVVTPSETSFVFSGISFNQKVAL